MLELILGSSVPRRNNRKRACVPSPKISSDDWFGSEPSINPSLFLNARGAAEIDFGGPDITNPDEQRTAPTWPPAARCGDPTEGWPEAWRAAATRLGERHALTLALGSAEANACSGLTARIAALGEIDAKAFGAALTGETAPCAITIMTAIPDRSGSLPIRTKPVRIDDEGVPQSVTSTDEEGKVQKRGPDQRSLFDGDRHAVIGYHALAALMSSVAINQHVTAADLAKGPIRAGRILWNKTAPLEDLTLDRGPNRLFAIDWDEDSTAGSPFAVPDAIANDLPAIASYILDKHLGGVFRGAGCVAQFTASHGVGGAKWLAGSAGGGNGSVRVRLYLWLREPRSYEDKVAALCAQLGGNPTEKKAPLKGVSFIDPSTLKAGQQIYTRDPHIEGIGHDGWAGKRWAVVRPDAPLISIPKSVSGLNVGKDAPFVDTKTKERVAFYANVTSEAEALTALAAAVEAIKGLDRGERNNSVNSIAYKVGLWVGRELLNSDEALEALTDAAAVPADGPVEVAEFRNAVASGFPAGIAAGAAALAAKKDLRSRPDAPPPPGAAAPAQSLEAVHAVVKAEIEAGVDAVFAFARQRRDQPFDNIGGAIRPPRITFVAPAGLGKSRIFTEALLFALASKANEGIRVLIRVPDHKLAEQQRVEMLETTRWFGLSEGEVLVYEGAGHVGPDGTKACLKDEVAAFAVKSGLGRDVVCSNCLERPRKDHPGCRFYPQDVRDAKVVIACGPIGITILPDKLGDFGVAFFDEANADDGKTEVSMPMDELGRMFVEDAARFHAALPPPKGVDGDGNPKVRATVKFTEEQAVHFRSILAGLAAAFSAPLAAPYGFRLHRHRGRGQRRAGRRAGRWGAFQGVSGDGGESLLGFDRAAEQAGR